jgi:hypothetical protein
VVVVVVVTGLTNDEGHGDLGVLLEDGGDGVNVGLVLGEAVLGDLVLAVGGQGRAVTVGEVVDHEGAHDWGRSAGGVLRFDVGQVCIHGWDLGGGVTVYDQHSSFWSCRLNNLQPNIGAGVGNLACLGLQAGGQRRNGQRVDLGGVVRVGVDLLAGKWVSGGTRGWRGGSRTLAGSACGRGDFGGCSGRSGLDRGGCALRGSCQGGACAAWLALRVDCNVLVNQCWQCVGRQILQSLSLTQEEPESQLPLPLQF